MSAPPAMLTLTTSADTGLPAQLRTNPETSRHVVAGGQYESSVAALEDKIVQRAVVEELNAIYEADFLGFSYGFRPGRSPHHALDALSVGIWRKKVNWGAPG